MRAILFYTIHCQANANDHIYTTAILFYTIHCQANDNNHMYIHQRFMRNNAKM